MIHTIYRKSCPKSLWSDFAI